MIYDSIRNADNYKGISPELDKALKFIQEQEDNMSSLSDRTDIDSDRAYALRQEYVIKPVENAVWEHHKRYLDIHLLLKGEELIRQADASTVDDWTAFDEKSDSATGKHQHGNSISLYLQPGYFTILFPEDAHMARCAEDKPCHVQKIVIKVRNKEQIRGSL